VNRLLPLISVVLVAALWLLYPPRVEAVRVLRVVPQPIELLVPDVQGAVKQAIVLPAVMYADIGVGEASYRHRRAITSAAIHAFGRTSAPVALLAAQIRAESAYRDVTSSAGAQGPAQFMPATAKAMAAQYPELRPANPRDFRWSFLAQALHMRDLTRLYSAAATRCDQFALALSAYHGGPTALDRERALANDPSVWFGEVEKQRSRTLRNHALDRQYVRRILLQLEPAYAHAGWHGGLQCRA
jgi:soluble lytic murein transglycosylase-like protein